MSNDVNDLSLLIDTMGESNFYPHGVKGDIKLIQTHASWIFLTGDFAYKIKKNVNLGFLNYTSLGKRKYYLEAELRLNREIAPELYLEVIPISKCQNIFVLGSSDNIVEYILKMRQFPQENL